MPSGALSRRIGAASHSGQFVTLYFALGINVRNWIEQWELSLDDIDLELPERLTEIELEQTSEIEGLSSSPSE